MTATNANGSKTAATTVTVSPSAATGTGVYAGYIASYQGYANQYYVSPSGSDSNNGSRSSPWATMTHADANTPACSVIWFASGNYVQSANTYYAHTTGSGTASCHKAFVSENYGGAVISVPNYNQLTGPALWSSGAFVDFVGFDISAPQACTGIYVDGHDSSGNYTGTLAYNRVHDIDDASGANKCNGNGGLSGAAQYYGNVVWNIGFPGNMWVHGIYADKGSIVQNNVVYNASGGCIQAGRNPANMIIENNTLYNCKWGIVIYTMSGSVTPAGNYVANNITANASQYDIYECFASACGGTAGGSNTYTNNISYNSSNHMETGTLQNNLTSDPKVVNAASPASGGDFHLQAGSPAIGAGTHTNAPAHDIDGTTRGNPPSIGAYE